MVVEKVAGALRVACLDAAASAAGLSPGMALATARALHPGIAVAEADPDADAALLEALADWAERYTPFIGLQPADGLVLDIGGSAHLFGGEEGLLRDLLRRLGGAGFSVRGAIAGTALAARALARLAPESGRGLVVPPGGEREAVSALPVAALGLPPEALAALDRLGLKLVGDLDARARGPLAARFGMRLLDGLDRALGRAGEPISPRRPLPACTAERRFAEPIGHEDDVRRSILSLAADLAEVLERRGEGSRRLELVFFRADGAVRRLAVETARPLRDPDGVLRLFRERLDALADPVDPGFGFDVLRLSALHTERLDPAQTGLDSHGEDEGALDDLADRLGARFGARRVLALAPVESHWPERASLAVPAQALARAAAGGAGWAAWDPASESPARPLRLFDPPERIEALAEIPDGPPIRFRWRRVLHAVRRAEGPERIAPEWWRMADDTLTRDYFRVEDEAGLRFWVYREGLWGRETLTPRWFMHGLFG